LGPHCEAHVLPGGHDWQTPFTQVSPIAQVAFELHALLT
jgi:hypothetical protein